MTQSSHHKQWWSVTRRSISIAVLFCTLLALAKPPGLFGKGGEPKKAQSGTNELAARVVAFWTAWTHNNEVAVNRFVLAQDRLAFKKIPRYTLLDFKVHSIQMSVDKKSAVVQTRIKRIFPMTNSPVDWILENQWVFRDGNWYLHYEQPQLPGLFSGSQGKGSSDRPDAGRIRPNPVVFSETTHDFGTVAISTPLQYGFEFENRGPEPVQLVQVLSSCFQQSSAGPCLSARSNASVFLQGTRGTIEAQWSDTSTPRKVEETIQVEFNNGQSFVLRFVATIAPPNG